MAPPPLLRCKSTAMSLGLALVVATGAALALQALRSPSWSRSLWQEGFGLGPAAVWLPPGTALSKTPSAVPALELPGRAFFAGSVSSVASLEMEGGVLQAELGSPREMPLLTSQNLSQYSLLVPTLSLQASGEVVALMSLTGGGIAAGTFANTVEMWPDASSVQQGGPPVRSLQASGWVFALLSLTGGGIAAGTSANTVDVWPNASSVRQGGRPVRSLQASGPVYALALLSGGGIAAGTDERTVDVWPNASSVHQGGPPVRSLQTSGDVSALLLLSGGGVAAGTIAETVDVWPNASSVHQGGRPVRSLQASGGVGALVLLSGGGIAAGTDERTVDVWPDASSVQQGGPPVRSLQASGPVYALLSLPGGGIAAGTSANTVDVWPDARSIQQGGPPIISLQASGPVYALVSLPRGGIAAGTTANTVDVWPDARSAQLAGPPIRSLQASGPVNALVSLPGGGIVAGTQAGTVDVWPDARSVQQGGPEVTSLQASGIVQASVSLPGVGIATGTFANMGGRPARSLQASDHFDAFWSLPGSTAMVGSGSAHNPAVDMGSEAVAPSGFVFTAFHLVQLVAFGIVNADGTPVVELWSTSGVRNAAVVTPGLASAAALLQSGHLVIATDNLTMGLWAPGGDSSWQPIPGASFAAKGPVRSLAPLPDGGFAALSAVGQQGLLELWNFSGALAGQAAERSLSLPTAPAVLLWWQEGLVVGSTQGVEFWPFTNLSSPLTLNASGAVTALKALPGGGLAVALQHQVCIWATAGTALQGAAPDVTLPTPSIVASMAILSDGTLVAGGAAFFANPCSAGSYSTDGLTCRLCPAGWLSRTGASSCQFPEIPWILQSSGLFAGLLLAGLALSHGLTHLPRHAAERLAASKQLLAAVGSVCCVAGALALLMAGWSPSLAVLMATAALGSTLLVPQAIAQSEAQFVALALLLLAGSQALLALLAPEGQPVFTVAGAIDLQKSSWSFAALAIGLSLAFVAYAMPRVKSFQEGRALPPPEEHPRAVIALQPLQPTFDMDLETEGSQSRACPPWMSTAKQAALRLAGSFAGEHFLSFAISALTVAQMSWQLSARHSGDVGATLVVVSILLAATQGLISGTAILTTLSLLPRCLRNATAVVLDRHFRIALALKKLALAMKLIVLTLPFPVEISQPYLWQQCSTPALCPSDCTNGPNQRDGTCGTMVSSENGKITGVCTCSALEGSFKWVMINAGFSVGVSLCFTLMAIPTYWKAENYLRSIPSPRWKLVAQTFLALVPAIIQMLYLYLISQAQECLAMADVAILIYPSMALELMASEVKRALHGWSQQRYSTIHSNSLLMTLRPFGVVLSSMAGALCMARASGVSSTWPSTTVDCSVNSFVWSIMSLSLFLGALAATIIGPVAAPAAALREDEGVTEQER